MLAEVGYQHSWIEILQLDFMRNAMLGGAMVAVAAGVIGYLVVLRRDAFATHALGHIGFPGATGAVLVGLPVAAGLVVFCVVGAVVVGALGKEVERRDVATGTVLAVAVALGMLFGSLATRATSTVTNVLFGNLLAVTGGQLLLFALVAGAVLACLAVVGRPLLFASVSPAVAEARGVRVRLLGVVFTVLLALVVAMAVQVIGTLLLFALVVTPAATALSLSARPRNAIIGSVVIALVGTEVGLVISAMFNLPPTFPIVTLIALVWGTVIAVTARRRRRGAAT